MTANNLRNALVASVALAVMPAPAHATVLQAISFDEKVEHAASIVLGTCIGQESRWDDARARILTYSTFRIEKAYKGMPAQQITIVTPGGSVGGIHQHAIGIPRFEVGDERVVFVRNSQAGPTVLYLDQGAYEVVQERGERIVKPVVTNAVLVDTQRGMAVAPEGARTLREFENSVRETIRKREAIRMEMIEREKREQASIWNVVQRNRTLVILALIGAILATWQLVKRW